MRINKYVSSAISCSRREADTIIAAGRVTINGETASAGTQVTEDDLIEIDGKSASAKKPQTIVIALNKRKGIECTTDSRVENNIINAVAFPERIFPIGRLDKESEGLILLTNDGNLVNPILRSSGQHEKEYWVKTRMPVSDAEITHLREGVDIGDKFPTKKCKVERVSPRSLRIILTEGRNRQIRRMLEAIGHRVMKLKRVRIMKLVLGDLPLGEWRKLSEKEIQSLRIELKNPS